MRNGKSKQLAAGKIGKVRIGAGHIVARLVSQSLFPRFIVERPAAQVQFHVGFNAELFGLVEAGNLDFAVCGLLETPPNLQFRELLVHRPRRDRAHRPSADQTQKPVDSRPRRVSQRGAERRRAGAPIRRAAS